MRSYGVHRIFFCLTILISVDLDLVSGKTNNESFKYPALNDVKKNGSGVKYNPEENMDTPQLIREAGFVPQTHLVETKDGYILQVHRIVNDGKPVVFLQHGLLCSSADWVINGREDSLGFLLANQNYDVWLGNFRGNTYSRRHKTLDPASKEFWMFSWDEMALYDLPAMLDHVLNVTNQDNLTYVGHSMGTTTIFALLSSNKNYEKKINLMFPLAPVATVGYMKSPIRYLADILPEIEGLVEVFGIYEFLPHNEIITTLSELFCKDLPAAFLCEDPIFLLCGFDEDQLKKDRIPVYMGHTPAGTSTQTVVHYAQMVLSKEFCRYDYGREINLEKYGQAKPPSYNLKNIAVPTVVFWGENDWLADPRDVKTLLSAIEHVLVKSIKVDFVKWSHLDFLWGKDANKFVYNELIQILKTHVKPGETNWW